MTPRRLLLAGCLTLAAGLGACAATTATPDTTPDTADSGGAASGDAAAAPVPAAAPVAAAAPSPEPVGTDPETGETLTTDAANNLPKTIGEKAELVGGDGTAHFTLSVARIRTATACPSRAGGTAQPENGMFLILDVTASLSDDVPRAAGGEDPYMPLVADAFHIDGADGTEEGTATEAAWGCFEDEDLAPAFLSPGDTAAGKVVLDTAHRHGKVVYDPEDNGGWSWDY
ncbi:hypothetical protein ACX8Z9_10420 [Arthrobacter halodurans]|uniref:Lipoprotein n=1 Tax=Arthrobacter halodurans TaxID=516699 RepID=A0ABV4UPA9_9MICC